MTWRGLPRLAPSCSRPCRSPFSRSGLRRLANHAKSIHENIDQTHDARLPAGLIMHIAHADQCAQKILRAHIGPYLAGSDRAVEQAPTALVSRSKV